jgi:hypothetical protein
MTAVSQQLILLQQYREKSYVSSILAEEAFSYYVFIKNIINIPLIITNSAMVVINSTITDDNLLKILNIILNASTGLILSLISNFKIHENINQFNTIRIKFTKISHQIDNMLMDDSKINNDIIKSTVEDYDAVIEAFDVIYPTHIKRRIKKQYEGKLSLPSVLQAEIVELCNKGTNCCIVTENP